MKTALRRILKYTPAVVLGLLVVVSGFSMFRSVQVGCPLPRGSGYTVMGLYPGVLMVSCDGTHLGGRFDYLVLEHPDNYSGPSLRHFLGFFRFDANGICFPIAAILTATLPVALMPFLSFRSRLSHYLAYTALVAVELAYYLRWQE